MEFETCEIPGSRDFVKEFLEGLDGDNGNPEKTTAYKIADKLDHFSQMTFAQLMRGEQIKHLKGDVYEVRITIKKIQYRFLGYTNKTTFYMVHAIVKKRWDVPQKDIDLAQERVNLVKNEN
jgi:phage-related protein